MVHWVVQRQSDAESSFILDEDDEDEIVSTLHRVQAIYTQAGEGPPSRTGKVTQIARIAPDKTNLPTAQEHNDVTILPG